MKKTIFISALALITVTACQNQTEEITKNEPENAINAVKLDAKGSSARMGEPANPSIEDPGPAGNDALIDCHTNYNDLWGKACVWVSGKLFRVTWSTMIHASNEPPTRNYDATQVSSCNCR